MQTLKDLATEHPAVVTYCVGGAATLLALYTAKKLLLGGLMNDSAPHIDAPAGTVVLHQIGRGTRAPSLSPFVVKLETFLRLAKIPYVNDHSVTRSSKGKTPWITLDGVDVADSQLCIKFLKTHLSIDLNPTLSPEQRAVSTAIQVMVDEHLYWTLFYNRWVYDRHMKVIKEHVNPPAPAMWLFKRMLKSQLHGQGMGRHSAEEVWGFMKEDLAALDNYLGDKRFMMGEEMVEVDCSVFGMLCQFVYMQEDDVCQGMLQGKFPRLHRYVERVKDLVWPDWEDVCTKGSRYMKS